MVSNSSRDPIDRYQMECETLSRFCRVTQRPAVMIHQRDPGLAAAFDAAGMTELLDDQGLVRHGKGEGMVVGLALAQLTGRRYVGFVDADNYVPGAVHEYVKAYAAGFHLAVTPYSMVRISWRTKPKIVKNRIFFNRWGRTSQVTNHFLNLLVADYSAFGTELIATGNAGEHAISMELARRMRFGSGYSVEPYEYLYLFEEYGGVLEARHPEVIKAGVEVFQIETRNPHFHEDKGSDHVEEMRVQALNVLYHSPISTPAVKEEIVAFLREHQQLEAGDEPARERIYPAIETMDAGVFASVLADRATTFRQLREERITHEAPGEPPIVVEELTAPTDEPGSSGA
ncbi:MAG TPA: mannosyl-3-phosphoglycerate synthase [Acidimicrobiia bacterium]|nr:mannosyl-3-phosphoglycerate synthase [Acidimicrobiia bacterium]